MGGRGHGPRTTGRCTVASACKNRRTVSLSILLLCSLAATSSSMLSPACESLEAPPKLAATPELDLSVLEEPHILTGMLKEPWSPPSDFLDEPGRELRVDLMPLDCSEAPRKLRNGTLIGPASVPFAMAEVLPMMRRSPEERGFHAYVRHISLDKFPAVAKRLPTVRALKLAGERLNSVNLWIGDGGMRSNLHWDGHDNILLQLTGTKTLLLLPPEATPFVEYVPLEEHRFRFENRSGTPAFPGFAPTNVTVENHALFDAFDPAAAALPADLPAARARVATIRPGEALFLPALWSHAVVSAPAAPGDQGPAAEAPPPPPPRCPRCCCCACGLGGLMAQMAQVAPEGRG